MPYSKQILEMICETMSVKMIWLRKQKGKMSIGKEHEAWRQSFNNNNKTNGKRSLLVFDYS